MPCHVSNVFLLTLAGPLDIILVIIEINDVLKRNSINVFLLSWKLFYAKMKLTSISTFGKELVKSQIVMKEFMYK